MLVMKPSRKSYHWRALLALALCGCSARITAPAAADRAVVVVPQAPLPTETAAKSPQKAAFAKGPDYSSVIQPNTAPESGCRDCWDRLNSDIDLSLADYERYYTAKNLFAFALGVG